MTTANRLSLPDRAKVNQAACHLVQHKNKPFGDCSTCDSMFSWVETLEHHEKTHETCIICGLKLNHLKEGVTVEDHLLKHAKWKDGIVLVKALKVATTTSLKNQDGSDPLVGSLVCAICDKTFKNVSDFSAHSHTAESETTSTKPTSEAESVITKPLIQCHICDAVFEHTEFRPHMAAHKIAKYKCSSCSAEFNTDDGFRKHILKHYREGVFPKTDDPQLQLLKCGECDLEIVGTLSFSIHKRSHEKLEKSSLCPECGIHFKDIKLFQEHMKKHEARTCELCDINLTSKRGFEMHMERHRTRENYACKECPKKYLHARGLKFHMYEHNFVDNCIVCNKKFKRSGCFQKHMESHSKEEIERAKANNPDKNVEEFTVEEFQAKVASKFMCEECGHQSNLYIDHKYHMMTHDKDKKFVCGDCKKRFKTKSELKQHAISHETASHFCEFCNQGFKRLPGLKQHVLTKHNEVRCYKCDICDKTFKTPSCVRSHKRVHKEGRKVQCHICNATLSSEANLRYHLRSHVQGVGTKCENCGRTYISKLGLKKHLLKCIKRQPPQEALSASIQSDNMQGIVRPECEEEMEAQ